MNISNTYFFILTLVVLNFTSSVYFIRIDITEEKKYSFSDETIDLVKNLDDILFFKIYLHGNLPSSYKKLSNELKNSLFELKAYNNFIEFEFIDPTQIDDEKYQMNLQKDLYQKGIVPIPHRDFEKNKMEETWIFPGFTAIYKNKEQSSSLIYPSMTNSFDLTIKESIEKIELLLIKTIKNLTSKKKNIGLIIENENFNIDKLVSFKDLVSQLYNIELIQNINGQLNALNNLDCIIINNPKNYISEKNKFIIDQYVMKGGKIIWLYSGTNANMDSLENKNETIVLPKDNTNLNDMFFNYGVRVNSNLVQSLQAVQIPIVTHYIKEKPQWTFFPWKFFPILNGNSEHLITNKTSPIKSQFPSSIDEINNHLNKTVLLKTTNNTKILQTPSIVSLDDLKEKSVTSDFTNNEQIISLLVEGKFNSLFENRIPQEIINNKEINFKSKNKYENKMIFISDGNFIENQFLKGEVLPIGFDKHTGTQYGNNTFIMNCIDYLLNNDLFINVRSKNLELRLLNENKVRSQKKFWQLFNLISPIILILTIGSILILIRKYKND